MKRATVWNDYQTYTEGEKLMKDTKNHESNLFSSGKYRKFGKKTIAQSTSDLLPKHQTSEIYVKTSDLMFCIRSGNTATNPALGSDWRVRLSLSVGCRLQVNKLLTSSPGDIVQAPAADDQKQGVSLPVTTKEKRGVLHCCALVSIEWAWSVFQANWMKIGLCHRYQRMMWCLSTRTKKLWNFLFSKLSFFYKCCSRPFTTPHDWLVLPKKAVTEISR